MIKKSAMIISTFIVFLMLTGGFSVEKVQNKGIVRIKARDRYGAEKMVSLYSAGYYALVVGCGDYQKGWQNLSYPVRDSHEVAGMLGKLGWEVDLLENPTGREFRTALNRVIVGPGKQKDRGILFWFSGHGHTLAEAGDTKLGYLVPSDAPNPYDDELGFMEKAVSMRDMETVARRIRSKHVLMLFDSCFSGSVFLAVKSAPSPYIEEKVSRPARQFITAGNEDEQVPDRSHFKTVFVQGIRDQYADRNRDGYVTGTEIGDYLQEQVINYSRKGQHPQFGKINDPKLDKGDFVFQVGSFYAGGSSTVVVPKPREPSFGKLTLDTSPSGAAIYIGGKNMGNTPLSFGKLKPGNYQIRAEMDGYRPEKKTVTIGKREDAKVTLYLDRIVTTTIVTTTTIRPEEPDVRLRSRPRTLSEEDCEKMVAEHNFYDSSWNKSGDFENDFVKSSDGKTVTDRKTGLMWQQSGSDEGMTYKDAQAYVRKLNSRQFAGHSDWRLPTIEELASLMESRSINGRYIDPVFDKKQRWCWSADKETSGSAWGAYFDFGGVYWNDGKCLVRAVRSRTI